MADYTPIDNELSVEIALVQAAHTLDAAVKIAIGEVNAERLQSLALVWMELAKCMISEEEEDDVEESEEVRLVGFSRTKEGYERIEE